MITFPEYGNGAPVEGGFIVAREASLCFEFLSRH